jgi:hypothetical protein
LASQGQSSPAATSTSPSAMSRRCIQRPNQSPLARVRRVDSQDSERKNVSIWVRIR